MNKEQYIGRFLQKYRTVNKIMTFILTLCIIHLAFALIAVTISRDNISSLYKSSIFQGYIHLYGVYDESAAYDLEYVGTGESVECNPSSAGYTSYIEINKVRYKVDTQTTVGSTYDIYKQKLEKGVFTNTITYYIGNKGETQCTNKMLNPAIRLLVMVVIIFSIIQFIVQIILNVSLREKKG
jgi:hypothetical protein